MKHEPPPNMSTLAPPAGEGDVYSASTKVGPASDDLLAIVRAAEDEAFLAASRNAPARPLPNITEVEDGEGREDPEDVGADVTDGHDDVVEAESVPPSGLRPHVRTVDRADEESASAGDDSPVEPAPRPSRSALAADTHTVRRDGTAEPRGWPPGVAIAIVLALTIGTLAILVR